MIINYCNEINKNIFELINLIYLLIISNNLLFDSDNLLSDASLFKFI
jgi:hypothetical protein